MKNLKKIPRQVLWAQLSAVAVWFLITLVEWIKNPRGDPGITIPVIVRGTEALAVLVITAFFILILEYLKTAIDRWWIRLFLLVVIYPGALLASLLSLGIRSLIGYSPPAMDGFFFVQSLHFYLPILLVLVAYAIVRNQLEVAGEREAKLEAVSRAREARWMMLRYQVNPHFLFNALNSIRALIGRDDESARRIVTELSEYFRYSLIREKVSLISLNEEISAVRSFLEIQKIRFHEKLEFGLELDPVSLQYAVPVFSVQTLVENGIKYGMRTTKGKLQLSVKSEVQDHMLVISVSNTGTLAEQGSVTDPGVTSGTGLVNLKERLNHLDPGSRFYLREEKGEVTAMFALKTITADHEVLESPDH